MKRLNFYIFALLFVFLGCERRLPEKTSNQTIQEKKQEHSKPEDETVESRFYEIPHKRFVAIGLEVSPVANGFVPLGVFDLRDQQDKEYSIKWRLKKGMHGEISPIIMIKDGAQSKYIEIDHVRLLGEHVFLNEVETSVLSGGLIKENYGHFVRSGIISKFVTYYSDDMKSLEDNIVISLSAPLFDWQSAIRMNSK